MKTSLDVVTYGEAMTLFVAAETGDLAKVGVLAGLAVAIVRRKSTNVSRVGHSEIPMPRPPRGVVHDRD